MKETTTIELIRKSVNLKICSAAFIMGLAAAISMSFSSHFWEIDKVYLLPITGFILIASLLVIFTILLMTIFPSINIFPEKNLVTVENNSINIFRSEYTDGENTYGARFEIGNQPKHVSCESLNELAITLHTSFRESSELVVLRIDFKPINEADWVIGFAHYRMHPLSEEEKKEFFSCLKKL